MLRVGIVGCGKIADTHASQIRRIKGCELVGVCDSEELMARQLADRFGISGSFNDLRKLLDQARPDVVHITTPPQTHFDVAKQCLLHGCHAYVEKPLTLNATEAEELIQLSEKENCKITVGHDLQFSHAMVRMRRLIRDGYLGGPPVHMESTYCYDIGEAGYAKALLADPQHWVRRLPGKLLQNVISHGVARIAEFITSEAPDVFAHGFVSPLLRSIGETGIVDELRVVISENGRTAYFTFSSQIPPALSQFRIYGPKNGLLLEPDREILIRLKGAKYKSYLEHFLSPVLLAKDYLGNSSRNLRDFLVGDLHIRSGMKHLIESFYRSITDNAPPPIPYREILLTSRIMDEIFEQVGETKCELQSQLKS